MFVATEPPRPTHRVLLAITCALLLLGVARPVGAGPAQEPAPAAEGPTLSWGIEPSSDLGPMGRSTLEYNVSPGTRITDMVRVSNLSDRPITLDVYASDAFTTEGGGFDLLPASEDPVDVGAWVDVPASPVTLEAGAHADLDLTIAVPGNASPGDHVGGIVASLARTGGGEVLEVDQRVGTRIYLRVDGPARPRLEVREVQARHRGSANPAGGALRVSYQVANTGNLRLAGRQTLRLTGPAGLPLRTVELEPLPELLPGSTLTQEVEVDGLWSLGRISAEVAIDPVTTDATAPGAGERATGSDTVAAWSPTVLAVLALLAAGLGVLTWRRRARPTPTGS